MHTYKHNVGRKDRWVDGQKEEGRQGGRTVLLPGAQEGVPLRVCVLASVTASKSPLFLSPEDSIGLRSHLAKENSEAGM